MGRGICGRAFKQAPHRLLLSQPPSAATKNCQPPSSLPLPGARLQLWSADEVFVTGTFAGQIPVTSVDGRAIGAGTGRGPLVHRLQALYAELCDESAAAGRAPLAP